MSAAGIAPGLRIAIVGAGWAGLAAAVRATQLGARVHVFEAARVAGGRARSIQLTDGCRLDNGQHILIGAYQATLQLMRDVGIAPEEVLLRQPLSLRFSDGAGLEVPTGIKAPLDLLAGIYAARGWTWSDRYGLLKKAIQWRVQRFECAPSAHVADICAGLSARVMAQLIEPLCVSALNVPSHRASGALFLRVLRDALFGPPGSADLLLPRRDLGYTMPEAAMTWLQQQGAELELGHRVQRLEQMPSGWCVDGVLFDQVILAAPAWESARLVAQSNLGDDRGWAHCAQALTHEPLATVYVMNAPPLPQGRAMCALHSDPLRAPAQFVFDRSQLGGPPGQAAFVISAPELPRDELQVRVLAQAKVQLGWGGLVPLQTIVEKRATFSGTAELQRPWMQIAPGLRACGDYVQGPYPATLEGAVMSGNAAAHH